jgi:ABC-type antimicrobial peptide transport system permease subunit
MFTVLGPLLLVLAAIGIYAVVAYSVSLQTREIGVRVALGASPRQVIAHFVGESLTAIGCGAIAGWTLAVVATMFAGSAGSTPFAVFIGVPALLLVVATAAAWLPARRATSVDPIVALRHE